MLVDNSDFSSTIKHYELQLERGSLRAKAIVCIERKQMNRKCMLLLVGCLTTVASVASGQTANVPDGVTSLWLFSNGSSMDATYGIDLINSNPGVNGSEFTGPATQIGTTANGTLFQDNGVIQSVSNTYFTANHGISANGGGFMVNEYTILMDYVQTSDVGSYNSFYQTDSDPFGSDGDLWTNTSGQLGVGGPEGAGYSALTYDPSTWHRIVLSVDNGNFFRAYVDGELFIDGSSNDIDGRFALNDNFHFLTDNDWEDRWGLLGTAATWDRALTTAEISGMGGWIGAAATPTPLFIQAVPEPSSMFLLGLGFCGLISVRRKK